jgi:hypothetical protein
VELLDHQPTVHIEDEQVFGEKTRGKRSGGKTCEVVSKRSEDGSGEEEGVGGRAVGLPVGVKGANIACQQ